MRTDIERRPVNTFRKPAAVAVAALALAVLPAGAQAHDGNHPFTNCTEAYENGHANIPEGDAHYKPALDRDRDGVGCDQPPADFVPAEDGKDGADDGADTGSDDAAEGTAGSSDGGAKDTELAETGGDSTTGYLAGGAAAVLLAGGGLVVLARRRRATR